MLDLFGSQSSAVISPCGQYRYMLGRRWGAGPACVFVMLNPSTADAEQDDPTIRRCIGFAKREGCGGLVVVNLYAFRATDPKGLLTATDPVGSENDAYIAGALSMPERIVVAAWGAGDRMRRAKTVLARHPGRFVCLGLSKDGHPRHPLYIKRDQPLFPFARNIDMEA